MAIALRQPELVTIEAFDAFVETQADDQTFELVAGGIVMMSNPTEAHEQIAANISSPLKSATDKRPCRTYIGGMRVQLSDKVSGIDKIKPDIVVRCGQASSSRTFITDPVAVVEVLSPSTIDIDRGPKLGFYKSIATMRHIILVHQDQMRVEHYRRTGTGFELQVLKAVSDSLELEAVGFELGLEAIYTGVEV
jgi:Uma2 family endonuclease